MVIQAIDADPTIRTLTDQRRKLRARIAGELGEFSAEHPKAIASRKGLDRLDKEIEALIASIGAGIAGINDDTSFDLSKKRYSKIINIRYP